MFSSAALYVVKSNLKMDTIHKTSQRTLTVFALLFSLCGRCFKNFFELDNLVFPPTGE